MPTRARSARTNGPPRDNLQGGVCSTCIGSTCQVTDSDQIYSFLSLLPVRPATTLVNFADCHKSSYFVMIAT
jgi:hypothetical protein